MCAAICVSLAAHHHVQKGEERMDSFVNYIYGEGDFLMILCRILVFVFALQFVTGLAYIIRGGVNGCS